MKMTDTTTFNTLISTLFDTTMLAIPLFISFLFLILFIKTNALLSYYLSFLTLLFQIRSWLLYFLLTMFLLHLDDGCLVYV